MRSIIQSIVRDHKRRVAIRELEALDDRTLRDIGVHRSQIHLAVNGLLNSKATSSEGTMANHNAPAFVANNNEYRSAA